jgi:predicted transcriptional regulator
MPDTTTVRINKDIYKELKRIADSENETIQKIMEIALQEYRTKIFFCQLAESVAKYKASKDDWMEEIAERKLWENTLADGLEDNDNEAWRNMAGQS